MNKITTTKIHQKKVNGKWVNNPSIPTKTDEIDIEYYYNIQYGSTLLFYKSINFKQTVTRNGVGLVTKLTSVSPTKDTRTIYLFDLNDIVNQEQILKALWKIDDERSDSDDEEE